MHFQNITYSTEDRLCYITLNRAEKRNALDYDLTEELITAFDFAENDPTAKIVILNATGKVFSAGADLDYLMKLRDNSYEENLQDSKHLKLLIQKIYNHNKIVIAQVEGHAIAGGCGLVTACDFCFCIPEAKFGYTEVKIGFIPAIVMVILLRKINESKARELLLTGKLIDADQAYGAGLVYEIIHADKIRDAVKTFAQQLSSGTSAQSVSATKKMIGRIQSMNLEEALAYAAEMNAKVRATDDCKKGIDAFLQKKQIKW